MKDFYSIAGKISVNGISVDFLKVGLSYKKLQQFVDGAVSISSSGIWESKDKTIYLIEVGHNINTDNMSLYMNKYVFDYFKKKYNLSDKVLLDMIKNNQVKNNELLFEDDYKLMNGDIKIFNVKTKNEIKLTNRDLNISVNNQNQIIIKRNGKVSVLPGFLGVASSELTNGSIIFSLNNLKLNEKTVLFKTNGLLVMKKTNADNVSIYKIVDDAIDFVAKCCLKNN